MRVYLLTVRRWLEGECSADVFRTREELAERIGLVIRSEVDWKGQDLIDWPELDAALHGDDIDRMIDKFGDFISELPARDQEGLAEIWWREKHL
jgi:hypothetical protein